MKKYTIVLMIFLGGVMNTFAQTPQPTARQDNYTQVITQRSNKIVTALNISDSVKFKRVRDIIVDQYRNLNDIYNDRNAKSKQIKEQAGNDKAAANTQIAVIDSNVSKRLKALHVIYLTKLNKELDNNQIDKVKDGMTYNVYPITYAAYQDELPNLTEAQKAKINGWLLEARENAIDAESSEKKHAWFGKFKGRINNYLSAQGYDMKKAGEEWQKRIKERNVKK
ncbi:DUF3826 domain-containing protein [Mucilaginibacter pocheonensis]|uniref:DUF3826 domain-containing protein n=1 Tax=Mucilaginibacter pocheonensis TaxID=398050 RepID=A0ABU1TFH2_9SPHI|nr:DUF3826 domain-containing protein [Mucilaginibacter pocheonensis]MDR6944006.1 hypothetical protein [Mucilaginibacter pocheonensis]